MSICSVPNCGREVKVIAKGLCDTHYRRSLRGLPLDTPLRRYVSGKGICSVDGCDRPHTAGGMCQLHWGRARNGTPLEQEVRTSLPVDITVAERLTIYAPPGEPDECWEWTRSTNKGYGVTAVGNGKVRQAHVVAWELAHGQALPAGMILRHTCDNPPCVNPAHLLLGTHVENSADRLERGQPAYNGTGFRHRTPDEIRAMRQLYDSGTNITEISRRFDCAVATAFRIVKRQAFPNIT